METINYQKQGTDFLEKYEIVFNWKLRGAVCPPWAAHENSHGGSCGTCGSTHGLAYRIRFFGKGRSMSFDYWGSKADMDDGTHPTPYDLLACASMDMGCAETFADFCADLGESEDSRRALATFKRADKHAKKLRAFFTETEREALAEIQ